jgi:NAD(P)-dependent dehydrogenase (short-subunit alcohol dehydrogenase family)
VPRTTTQAGKIVSVKRSAPVALVTGGGRGIGHATVAGFAAAGYTVVVAERQPALGQRAVRALRRAGAEAVFVRTDVSSARSVERTVRSALRRYGRLDCVVNNAGVLRAGSLARLPLRDLERMVAVNLRGPLLVSRSALPTMLRRRSGTIVNVASLLGKTGIADYVTYCATKFGVVGLSKALADELTGTGVRVWAVCPGLTDTAMAREAGVTPRERSGLIRPESVARVIVDLATGRKRSPSGAAVDVTR